MKRPARALANVTEFGLSASVRSSELENAIQTTRHLRRINPVIDGIPEPPIGGHDKCGLGRELGRYGFDEHCQFKELQMTLGSPPRSFE